MEYLGPIALFWVALLVFLIVGMVGRVAGVTRFARVLIASTGAAVVVTIPPWTWAMLWRHNFIPFDSLWLGSLLTLFAFFMLIHFFGSPVKVALGEFDAARQLIDEAESFAPGDAFIKVAQAELELACGPVSSAQAAVDAAASAVHANPFTLLDHELRTLRQRLEGLVGSPTPILLFPVTPGIPST